MMRQAGEQGRGCGGRVGGWIEAYLVRVEHEDVIPTIDVSEELQSTKITFEVASDLEFVIAKAIDLGLF